MGKPLGAEAVWIAEQTINGEADQPQEAEERGGEQDAGNDRRPEKRHEDKGDETPDKTDGLLFGVPPHITHGREA